MMDSTYSKSLNKKTNDKSIQLQLPIYTHFLKYVRRGIRSRRMITFI